MGTLRQDRGQFTTALSYGTRDGLTGLHMGGPQLGLHDWRNGSLCSFSLGDESFDA